MSCHAGRQRRGPKQRFLDMPSLIIWFEDIISSLEVLLLLFMPNNCDEIRSVAHMHKIIVCTRQCSPCPRICLHIVLSKYQAVQTWSVPEKAQAINPIRVPNSGKRSRSEIWTVPDVLQYSPCDLSEEVCGIAKAWSWGLTIIHSLSATLVRVFDELIEYPWTGERMTVVHNCGVTRKGFKFICTFLMFIERLMWRCTPI